MTEGIIDHLRSIEGTTVAAVDPRPRQPRPRRPQGQPALQRRRRRRLGDRPQARAAAGTGAPPASRPTSSYDELVEFLCGEVAAQLGLSCRRRTPRPVSALRQARRRHLPRRGRRRSAASAAARPATPAPSTRSPPACCWSCSGRATRLQRFLVGLPKTYLATARLGWRSSTGDPDGELTETGAVPERLELPTGTVRQRVPMTSAVRVGGERLYRKAHRGEEVETPEREVEVHRAELLGGEGERARYEIECSAGHLRPHPDRDARRRLLRGAAADRDRPASGSRTPGERGAERRRGSAELGPGASRGGGRCDGSDRQVDLPLPRAPSPRPARTVAIGTFDGVHVGHQAVIDDADTVLTFEPHPLEVLHPAARRS